MMWRISYLHAWALLSALLNLEAVSFVDFNGDDRVNDFLHCDRILGDIIAQIDDFQRGVDNRVLEFIAEIEVIRATREPISLDFIKQFHGRGDAGLQISV